MELEGTPEFNRGFRATVGNEEAYRQYIEQVVEPMREIDIIGNAITAYRWANYLQDAVIQYCEASDYVVGNWERADIAQGIVNARLLDVENEFERQQLQEAFQIWAITNRRRL